MSNNQIKMLTVIGSLSKSSSKLSDEEREEINTSVEDILNRCESVQLEEKSISQDIESLFDKIEEYCSEHTLDMFKEVTKVEISTGECND